MTERLQGRRKDKRHSESATPSALQLVGGKWPDEWMPLGWSRVETHVQSEPFAEWWLRLRGEFQGLDSRVLEQWVHAHWNSSPYFGFNVQAYRSELVRLSTETLISSVGHMDIVVNEPFFPDCTYDAFSRVEYYRPMLTKGTWDMPILLIESPSGFSVDEIDLPQFPLWLLEGHRRYDFMRALHAYGQATDEHDVFVLRAK